MDEAILEHIHALPLQTLWDVFEGGTMKRCRICKGLGDVRGDGLCGGCYDARMAGQFGLSYGRFVALTGTTLGGRWTRFRISAENALCAAGICR